MKITMTVTRTFEMNEQRVLAEPGFEPPARDSSIEEKQRWLEIGGERIRQEIKWRAETCAGENMSLVERLAVLAEEFGEVARLAVDLTWPHGRGYDGLERLRLRTELIQVAAVAAAWAESL